MKDSDDFDEYLSTQQVHLTRYSALKEMFLGYFRAPVPVDEGEKKGLHFKNKQKLYCRCRGCQLFADCHGLCRPHAKEKRRLGYAC